jgi:copper chaperone CopZ
MQKHTFKLKGLHCPACKKLTEKRISTIEGVVSVNVSLDESIADITAQWQLQPQDINAVLAYTPYEVYE